eukprot:gb/GECG01016193.1/.p1 GENE.gb/GECG01016193.1/~~gb/GECG01016193.1/.p1  ORF type:complete len:212 (+),score=24.79 gb/GECG01016193.1/:1-636(+)
MGVAPSRKELIDITTKSGDSIQLRYTLKGVGKGECNKIYLSKGGDTPLHYAASHGKAQIVRTLIREFGADTDVENILGYTPLHYAAQNGNVAIVQVLTQEFGAKVESRDSMWGETPLHFAASKGHCDIVRLLVEDAKTPVNVEDSVRRVGESSLQHWKCSSHRYLSGGRNALSQGSGDGKVGCSHIACVGVWCARRQEKRSGKQAPTSEAL